MATATPTETAKSAAASTATATATTRSILLLGSRRSRWPTLLAAYTYTSCRIWNACGRKLFFFFFVQLFGWSSAAQAKAARTFANDNSLAMDACGRFSTVTRSTALSLPLSAALSLTLYLGVCKSVATLWKPIAWTKNLVSIHWLHTLHTLDNTAQNQWVLK